MSIHISASLLVDYIQCNKRTFFRINAPESSVSSKESKIGVAIHRVIEEHPDNKSLGTAMLSNLLGSIEGIEDADTRFGLLCIENYYTRFSPLLDSGSALSEKFFKIKLEPDVFLVGRIDRISNGIIYDWKSKRVPPKKLVDDIQFLIYEYAYRKIYGKKALYSVFGALATGEHIVHRSTELGKSTLFEELIPAVIANIKRGTLPKTGLFSGSCFRCQYKGTCLKVDDNVVDS